MHEYLELSLTAVADKEGGQGIHQTNSLYNSKMFIFLVRIPGSHSLVLLKFRLRFWPPGDQLINQEQNVI